MKEISGRREYWKVNSGEGLLLVRFPGVTVDLELWFWVRWEGLWRGGNAQADGIGC